MILQKDIKDAKFILSKNEIAYKEVLDDFNNTKEINILTFNISSKCDRLIDNLKNLKEETKVYIVTNIPQRYKIYYSEQARQKAKMNIEVYMRKLLPSNFDSQIIPFFNFNNHAKIIVTDSIAYVGSANYSDESQDNYESGILSKDKEFILFLRNDVFPTLIADSEYYFENKVVEYRLFTLNIYLRLSNIYNKMFNYGFYGVWDDYPYSKEERVYITTISEFQIGVNDLEELKLTLDELEEIIDDLDDEYEEVNQIISKEKIETLTMMISYGSEIYNLCNFSYQDFCDSYIEKYSIEAYDENLSYYAERAFEKSSDEFERIAIETKDEIDNFDNEFKALLEEMSLFIEKMKAMSKTNNKIDNS